MGGRAQGEHPASPAWGILPIELSLVLPHGDHWGNLWGFSPGGQTEVEKWAGLSATSTQILPAFLHIVMPKQKSQPMALPFFRAKSVVPLGKFVQFAFMPDLGLCQWAILAVVYAQQWDPAGGPADQRARPVSMPNSASQPVVCRISQPSLWPCPTSGLSL